MAARGPHETLLYRLVALVLRPHRRVDLEPGGRIGFQTALFMAAGMVIAVIILIAAAAVAEQAWLLLPLGPSAYVLLRMPMSERSSPRALIGAHALACGAGLLVGWLSSQLAPSTAHSGPGVFQWGTVIEFAAAATITGLLMSLLRCVHAPAVATSALAAWGILASPQAISATVGAAVLLAIEGIVFMRYLAGLPYPLWTTDPNACRPYGALAGAASERAAYWEQLETRLMRRVS